MWGVSAVDFFNSIHNIKLMNVYDFDKTIYAGDSTVDFYIFCLFRYPCIWRTIPHQICRILYWGFYKHDTVRLKESFFLFLHELPSGEEVVDMFWKNHQRRIKEWYLNQRRENDVIISASPEFLLGPICRQMGIRELIATKMDPHTGKISGDNCKGQEKVKRFLQVYPQERIEKFYSDSTTDAPLARLAEKAFIVSGERISSWEQKVEDKR